MDHDRLPWHITVGVRVAHFVLSSSLLEGLFSFLLTVDYEHVDAQKDATPANYRSNDNSNVCIAASVIAPITVAITVAASPVGRSA